MTTRIPIKRLGEGELQFRAVPRHMEMQGQFIPVTPEEPFAYLSRLENAFMEIRSGKAGIVLPTMDQNDNSSPTGQ